MLVAWVSWIPLAEFLIKKQTVPSQAYLPSLYCMVKPPIQGPTNQWIIQPHFIQPQQSVYYPEPPLKQPQYFPGTVTKKVMEHHFKQTPHSEVREPVWLNTKSILTNLPTHKQSKKRHSPFTIGACVAQTIFKLYLPLKWKSIQPVFRTFSLEIYGTSSKSGNPSPLAPPQVGQYWWQNTYKFSPSLTTP